MSPDSPLVSLVPEMEMSNVDNGTGITNAGGDMTRVDETIEQPQVVKIKQLLPTDHLFQSFTVTSSKVLKMLSATQTEHVLDMLAKASYVRCYSIDHLNCKIVSSFHHIFFISTLHLL